MATDVQDPLVTLSTEALDSPALREMTDRVAELYARLQARMLQPQVSWGHGKSLVGDPAFDALPLPVRKAKAFEFVCQGMPIAIEEG